MATDLSFFFSLLFFLSTNQPDRTQLSSGSFLSNNEKKPQQVQYDADPGMAEITTSTSPSSTLESVKTEAPKVSPPTPPYPLNPKEDKKKPAAAAAAAEKVQADKAFSSTEQQKEGKTKSYEDTEVEGSDTKVEKISKVDVNKGKTGSSGCGEKYVVMVDAGLSGLRVHVYKFDTCYSPPKLLNEDFEMLKPGLSSFDTDVEGAAHSLDPLLELAVKSVPKDHQKCTPIAVKATAGLRLLGEAKSKAILDKVRSYLEKEWPFYVVPGDGISIMEGSDEGVFAWITANYLMGNIGSSEKTPTAAVFDLGGGSTQIVFEPEFKTNEKLAKGDHKYDIEFGGRLFELYQFSHLGYGLMEGRQKIYKVILDSYLKSDKKPTGLVPVTGNEEKATVDIVSPCVAPGNTAKNVKVKYDKDTTYLVNFVGPENNMGAQCRFLAEKVLNKDQECTVGPCSFNGVYQPSLMKNFKQSSDLYVFSFFYDRTNPLGMPSLFTLKEMTELTSIVCSGDSFWEKMLGAIDGSMNELANEPNYCLDLSFMVAMLHTGYEIPLDRELKTAKKIAGNELGWCLGASLPLLEGGQCKVEIEE